MVDFPHGGGANIWRDFNEAGNPASKVCEPAKPEIRNWAGVVETSINAALAATGDPAAIEGLLDEMDATRSAADAATEQAASAATTANAASTAAASAVDQAGAAVDTANAASEQVGTFEARLDVAEDGISAINEQFIVVDGVTVAQKLVQLDKGSRIAGVRRFSAPAVGYSQAAINKRYRILSGLKKSGATVGVINRDPTTGELSPSGLLLAEKGVQIGSVRRYAGLALGYSQVARTKRFRILHGVKLDGTKVGYSAVPVASGPLPVILNAGAFRRYNIFKARSKQGGSTAFKHKVITWSDSTGVGGYRIDRYGGYQQLYATFGDGGAGWVSWQTGNIRSQTNEYYLTGGGESSNANWQVLRRSAGNNNPDISCRIPLQTGAIVALQAPATSAPLSACDFHYNAIAPCTIEYCWNSGSWTSLTLDETGGPKKASLTGLPSTSGWLFEWRVASFSGAPQLSGAMFESSNNGISLSMMAVNGANTFDYLNNDAALWKQGVALLGGRSHIIQLSTNDQLDTNAGQWITNNHSFITRLREIDPACDICIMLAPENFAADRAGVNPKSTYEAVLREYCGDVPSIVGLVTQTACGVPGGDYSATGALPLWDEDGVHPAPDGGRAISMFRNHHLFQI